MFKLNRVFLAGVFVMALMSSLFGKTQKIGGVTWSYEILDGWYDCTNDEYYEGKHAVVLGAKGVKGKMSIPSALGGCPVWVIDDWAFEDNQSITSVIIPEGVKCIGAWAFEECRNITSVKFPEGLIVIGFDAFCGCRKLKNVTIPSTVNSGIAFVFCKEMTAINVADNNPYFKSVDGVVYSKDGTHLVYVPAGRTGEFIVPCGVEAIEPEAFGGGSLSRVHIPEWVDYISTEGPFVECHKLKSITVDENNPNYRSVDGVLFSKDESLLIAYPAGKTGVSVYTVPQTVTRLGDDVFSGCQFNGIVLPSTLSRLSYETFEGCEKLTEIIVGTGLETVDDNAFYYVPKLKTVTLPESVKWIARLAFEECESLKTLYYPVSAERAYEWISDCPGKKIAYTSARLVSFDSNDGNNFSYDRNVVNGQRVGILPVPVRDGYVFGGWWTAPTGGNKISADTKVKSDVTYYARWLRKVSVSKTGSGSVKGAGNWAIGDKVTLKATPSNKDAVFVRWEIVEGDVSFWPEFNEKYRQPSVSFTMPDQVLSVKAVFAAKKSDYTPVLNIKGDDPWYVKGGEDVYVEIDSLSYSSLSHDKTLPSGIGLVRIEGTDNCYWLKVTDASKMKPGVYTAKFTAKNRASKKSSTKSVRIITPNSTAAIDAGLIDGLQTSTFSPYSPEGGMKISWALADLGIEVYETNGWKLASVSGLPSGLKWNGEAIVGTPSKAGIYTVTFTMQKKVKSGKKTVTMKSVATATFKVDALLPEGLAGTYNGFVNTSHDNDSEEYFNFPLPVVDGDAKSAKVTVTAAGKITAKIGDVSLTGTGFDSVNDDVYSVMLKKTQKITSGKLKGGTKVWQAYFEIDTKVGWDEVRPVGWYSAYTIDKYGMAPLCPPEYIMAQRNPFAADEAKAVAAAIVASGKKGKMGFAVMKAYEEDFAYTLECAECMVGGKAAVTATAKSNGTVMLAGTIAKTKVSGTAVLNVSPETWETYEDYGEYDNPITVTVPVRTATARFFTSKFVIEIVYTLEDNKVIYTSGRVWKK